MSNALLSSKIAILEEAPGIRSIDAVQTSVVAMIGITERGPLGVPTLVTSWEEYVSIFGGYTADGTVALAAFGFFENGGQFLYVVRTVHYTDPATPGSATSDVGTLTLDTAAAAPSAGSVTSSNLEPFDLEPAQTLVIAVDGSAPDTATFNAAAAARVSAAETFTLTNGMTLTLTVDGGALQTIAFLTAEFVDISNATAEEVAAVINAKINGAFATVTGGGTTVTITSDTRGTGSHINVTGGTANAELAFTTGDIAGTGNVADIDAVTVAEVKTIVEAAMSPGVTVTNVGGAARISSNTTGASSSVQVQASSTADTPMGYDNATHSGSSGAAADTLRVDGKTDGTYANSLQIKIADATSGEAERFDLQVIDDGLIVETFPNLSMVDTDSRFAESVINSTTGGGSNLVAVTDLDSVAASQRPANGTFGPLTGGSDGLSGLVDADFIGSSVGKTGIRSLDEIQGVSLLAVPGQATAAIQNAMITYCEVTRDMSMFAILDPPAGQSATGIITYYESTAAVLGISEFGAAYWPRVKVLNPNRTVFGNVDQIVVAPSGIIAGVYTRIDASKPGGVYDPPAGSETAIMRGVLGFETEEVKNEAKRDLVFPKRINILTSFPGAAPHIDGSRTLKGNGNFPYVSQRRGAIFIEQSVKAGTEFARHQNNTPKLRRTVEKSVRSFLLIQLRNGAFASEDPDAAFFVDVSDKLNPPSEINGGRLNARVGLAFNTPAEFLVFRFTKDTRALDQELAG